MDAIGAMPGVELAYDWLAVVQSAGAANEGLTAHQREAASESCLSAVDDSPVFWLLAPQTVSRGCWVELGSALRCGCRVIVSGDYAQSIFTAGCVLVDTDDQALTFLRKWLTLAGVPQ